VLFKIIFFVLFLLGVSLFISSIATIILKKKSRKNSKVRTVDRNKSTREEVVIEPAEKSKSYQQVYLDRVSDVRKSMTSERVIPVKKVSEANISIPTYQRKVDYNKIKWIFIILIIVGVLFSGSLFWIKSYKTHPNMPKLYLCENVDFLKLRPINVSDRFTRGNITVFYKSKVPIEQDYLLLEIYKLGEAGFIPYAKKKIKIKPEWTSFVATALFDQLGSYIVEIKSSDNKLIAQKLVEIVPDSYAYKAKPTFAP